MNIANSQFTKKTGPFASIPSKAQQKRELLSHLKCGKHVNIIEAQNSQNTQNLIVAKNTNTMDLDLNVQKCVDFLKSQGYIVTKPTFYNIQLNIIFFGTVFYF